MVLHKNQPDADTAMGSATLYRLLRKGEKFYQTFSIQPKEAF